VCNVHGEIMSIFGSLTPNYRENASKLSNRCMALVSRPTAVMNILISWNKTVA